MLFPKYLYIIKWIYIMIYLWASEITALPHLGRVHVENRLVNCLHFVFHTFEAHTAQSSAHGFLKSLPWKNGKTERTCIDVIFMFYFFGIRWNFSYVLPWFENKQRALVSITLTIRASQNIIWENLRLKHLKRLRHSPAFQRARNLVTNRPQL